MEYFCYFPKSFIEVFPVLATLILVIARTLNDSNKITKACYSSVYLGVCGEHRNSQSCSAACLWDDTLDMNDSHLLLGHTDSDGRTKSLG